MGKLIKKTVLVTVLILVTVLLLSVFGVTLFAPKYAGDVCSSLGLKSSAVKCYERVYLNSGEYEDLMTLVDSAIFAGDLEIVSTYGDRAIEREVEFLKYCSDVDAKNDDSTSGYTSHEFYVKIVMDAFYSIGNKEKSASIVINNIVSDTGYSRNSALYFAVKKSETDKDFGGFFVAEYKKLTNKTFNNYVQFRNDMKALGYTL